MKDAHAFLQHVFHQDTTNNIMQNWLLLDSGSTLSVICNEELLKGIHNVNEAIRVRCNTGKKIVNEKGFLPLFQEDVWFAREGFANIIGLDDMCKRFVVEFNHAQRTFSVQMPHGTLIFKRSSEGLFYYDTAEDGAMNFTQIFTPDQVHSDTVTNLSIPGIIDPEGKIITTTTHTAEGFSQRDVKDAHFARMGQGRIGCPSDVDYQHMVRFNLIKNVWLTLNTLKMQLTSLVANMLPPGVRWFGVGHGQL